MANGEEAQGQTGEATGQARQMELSASPQSPPVPPSSSEALVFTSPDQGAVFPLSPNIPADKQKIRLSVRPANGVQVQQVSLLVNGQSLANGLETLWQMTPGVYTFEAVGIDQAGHEIRANSVTVEVVE